MSIDLSNVFNKAIDTSQSELSKGASQGTKGLSFSASKNDNYLHESKLSKEDRENRSKTAYLPPDWDYKTSQRGPNGEDLPKNAIGWNPYGEADYGPGITGYWNKFVSRLQGEKPAMGMVQQAIEETKQSQVDKSRNVMGGGLGGSATYDVGGAALDKPTSIGEGLSNVTGVVVDTALDAANAPAKIAKQLTGAIAMTKEQLADNYVKPHNIGSFEVTDPRLQMQQLDLGRVVRDTQYLAGGIKNPLYVEPEKRQGFIDMLEEIGATMPMASDVLIYSPWNLKEGWQSVFSKDNLQRNWDSSRMLYTAFGNETLKQEYLRRYDAGEDPRMLAMELENPLLEMTGEMMIDPLNALGNSAGKAANLTRAENYAKDFDIISDYAKIMGIEDVSKMDTLLDVGKVNERVSEFAQVTNGAEAETKLTNLFDAITKKAVERNTSIDSQTYKFGLAQLTSMGKKDYYMQRGTSIVNFIAYKSENADDAIDTIRALMDLSSGDVSRTAKGWSVISHSPNPQFLLSEAAGEFGHFMNKLNDEINLTGDFTKGLEHFNLKDPEHVEEFISHVGGLSDKSISKSMPTLTEILDDVELAKQRASKGLQLSERDAKLLENGQYDYFTKSMARFDNWAQKNFVGPINKFFANVYMGMSPGYAFRNAITNTTHIFIDQGLKAGLESVDATFNILLNKGGFVTKCEDDIAKMLGGAMPYTTGKGMGGTIASSVDTGKMLTRRMNFAALSNDIEKGHSSVIVKNSIENTMKKMLVEGRAIPDTAELVTKGMTPDEAKTMINMLKNSWGDWDATYARMVEGRNNGFIKYFEANSPIQNEKFGNMLSQIQVKDDVIDAVINSATKEEALLKLDEISKQILDYAENSKGELPHISLDELASSGPDGRGLQVISDAHRDGEVAGEIFQQKEAQVLINRQHQRTYQDALNRIHTTIHSLNPSKEVDDIWLATQNNVDYLLQSTRAENDKLVNAVTNKRNLLLSGNKKQNYSVLWDAWDVRGAKPDTVTKSDLITALWDDFFEDQSLLYTSKRMDYKKEFDAGIELMMKGNENLNYGNVFDELDKINDLADKFDNAVLFDDGFYALDQAAKKNFDQIVRLAKENGIGTATRIGDNVKNNNAYILNVINEYSGGNYKAIGDVPYNVAENSIMQHVQKNAEKTGREFKNLMSVSDLTNEIGNVERLPAIDENSFSMSRSIYEQRLAIKYGMDQIKNDVSQNWGKIETVLFDKDNETLSNAFLDYGKLVKSRVAEAQTKASVIADHTRNFTLLNYQGKRGFDLALSYIYPYQFWYSRTYTNWMKRIASDPKILASYAKYRHTLEKVHAGMPDWWKYQINSNELLGLDSEHPLFFNLEATLNPLNGLTGVDFNDPLRHPEGNLKLFTETLDALNKFGPSIWTPYNLLAAVALKSAGEDDAAARWGGRLIPQTAVIKSITSLLGVKPGGIEADLSVQFFSGGMDPYERSRVGRALGSMVEDGTISQAQAEEAARLQSGDVWDLAKQRATVARAPGQMASFFMGVGFKGRSSTDMQIDQMYEDYFRLINMRPDMSADTFKKEMASLQNKYPFMNTVILSRKGGEERDINYAYSVLSRVPPGESDDLSEATGLDYRLVQKFYDNKGFDGWAPEDRDIFMAGISNMGAVLDIPDFATKQEWLFAQSQYAKMKDLTKERFGEDIQEKIDSYFDKKGTDQADAYLQMHPEIGQALDYQNNFIVNDQLLSAYYSSYEKIEKYYTGKMYDEIENKLGADIYDKWDEYYALKDESSAKAKQYFRQHPELKQYIEMKEEMQNTVNSNIVRLSLHMPEGEPVNVREDARNLSIGQQDLINNLTQQQNAIPMETWQYMFDDSTLKNIATDKTLSDYESTYLSYFADMFDMSVETVTEMIKNTYQTVE